MFYINIKHIKVYKVFSSHRRHGYQIGACRSRGMTGYSDSNEASGFISLSSFSILLLLCWLHSKRYSHGSKVTGAATSYTFSGSDPITKRNFCLLHSENKVLNQSSGCPFLKQFLERGSRRKAHVT